MTVVFASSGFSGSVHVSPESSITPAAESPSVWVSAIARGQRIGELLSMVTATQASERPSSACST